MAVTGSTGTEAIMPGMKRREFITLFGSGALAWPLAARSQPTMLRIGVVSGQPRGGSIFVALEQRLAELGYRAGKNFAFEFIEVSNIEGFESGYRTLADHGVDVILASGPEISLKSAMAATGVIPIVMIAIDYDPFARGYVSSLARPGGNVTGVFFQQIELSMKRIQVFMDAIPRMQHAAVFWDAISADQWQATQDAAERVGLRLAGVELREPPYDFEQALAQLPPDYRGALVVLTSPFFFRDRERIADFALRNRMASMFAFREYVETGGLLSYGPSITGMYRRAAEYVDRIARGAKPSDLPIEQPTRFELIINMKTVKTLGLGVPLHIQQRADELID